MRSSSMSTEPLKTSSNATNQLPASASNPAPCGKCNKMVTTKDKALECEICLTWFHTKCHNIPKALYDAMTMDNSNCHWYCDNCNKGAHKIFKCLTALTNTQDEMQQQLQTLASQNANTSKEIAKLKTTTETTISQVKTDIENRMDTLRSDIKTDIDSLKAEITTLHVAINSKQEVLHNQIDTSKTSTRNLNQSDFEKFREHMTQMELINSKRMNLVIHNIPESGSADKDLIAASDMIAHEFKIKTQINKATRMGKPDEESKDKPRLLRIEMTVASDRKLILQRAPELRSSEHETYSKVYIRPDLTRRQREESKNLREKLATIRTNQPDKKWAIKQGRIVENTNNA